MDFKIKAKTVDSKENYYGTIVSDPYQWLEDSEADDTKEWLNEQQTFATDYVSAIPVRASINERLRKLSDYKKYYHSLPFGGDVTIHEIGEYYYFFKNEGLQNQAVLYRTKDLAGTNMETVLDPNKESVNGRVSISNIAFDPSGKKLAYATSVDGSDWQEIKVRKLETGQDYGEVLTWCKFCTISWDKKSEGFYYNRYPAPSEAEYEDQHNDNKVYWHKVGSKQSEDILVFESEDKELALHPVLSGEGTYLVIKANRDFNSKNQLFYKNIKTEDEFKPLFNKEDALYTFLGSDRNTFYIYTNYEAPKGRVVAVNINQPHPDNWKNMIGETDDTIVSIKQANNHFVVCYLHDAHHILVIYDVEGAFKKEVPLPADGSVTGISSKNNSTEMYIGYTSFLCPTVVYRYSFCDKILSKVFSDTNVDFDTSTFGVKQVFYPSKDNTQVPMYVVYKKGLKLNGENPVLLHSYGGFNRARTPFFSPSNIMWMEDGGVFALANIRGGAEYGEEWHRGGMGKNKQNVFDDFIAAAEWLIENHYTQPSKLAISGRSNGGLLVAACMLQRPELFGAVVSEVPVIDMLRFPKFTIGRFWIFEFGSVQEGEETFKNLYSYSPLHNVKEATSYPPIMITSADTDTRVDPLHSKKFTATLQSQHKGINPVLFRMEDNAGHGAGKPVMKLTEEQTDIYAFLYQSLGISR